jgi:tRNA G18 (ribose-2'-O)-methylase SpoU
MKNNQGYFGIGIYHAKNSINVGTLWRSANIFGASFIFTIGNRYKRQSSDTMKTPMHIPLFQFDDFATFKNYLPKFGRLVAIEIIDSAKDLRNYCHHKQSVYLLGAEDTGIPESILEKCHDVIKIPGDYCLNVSTAGSIVMYDRLIKNAHKEI